MSRKRCEAGLSSFHVALLILDNKMALACFTTYQQEGTGILR